MKIDFEALKDYVEERIRLEAQKAVSGPEKLDAVIEAAAEWLDDHTGSFMGPFARPMFRFVMRFVGEIVFLELRKLGQV
jgi:hypothetical protein